MVKAEKESKTREYTVNLGKRISKVYDGATRAVLFLTPQRQWLQEARATSRQIHQEICGQRNGHQGRQNRYAFFVFLRQKPTSVGVKQSTTTAPLSFFFFFFF